MSDRVCSLDVKELAWPWGNVLRFSAMHVYITTGFVVPFYLCVPLFPILTLCTPKARHRADIELINRSLYGTPYTNSLLL